MQRKTALGNIDLFVAIPAEFFEEQALKVHRGWSPGAGIGCAQLVTFDPGQEASFDATFPPLEASHWTLELDCGAEKVAWFAQTGSTPTHCCRHRH